ncbi:MAG TPA: hypothetical protein VF167_06345 [Longimicrobiaceae bacterium]
MSTVIEALLAVVREARVSPGPYAFAVGAGALGGALLALAIARIALAIVRFPRRRSSHVASLFPRRGAQTEIVRAGIPRDAMELLRHVRASPRGRRNLPLPARIAVPLSAAGLRANRDLNLELVATEGVAHDVRRRRRSARPLPLRPPTHTSTHSLGSRA